MTTPICLLVAKHGMCLRVGCFAFLTVALLRQARELTAQPFVQPLLAAELVFARLDGSTEPAQRRIVQVQLVERGSGELAPVRSVV